VVVSTVQGLLRTVVLAARRALGLPATLRTEDRRILEQVILPEYARRPDIARVLFVGCAPYTQRYGETFGGREYWTIDPVARRRRYGSERHIVDRLQNLGNHVPAGYFDLVVCNGVLGWGLNAPAAICYWGGTTSRLATGCCPRRFPRCGDSIWRSSDPLRFLAGRSTRPIGTYSISTERQFYEF
jgi:hypothetical protein